MPFVAGTLLGVIASGEGPYYDLVKRTNGPWWPQKNQQITFLLDLEQRFEVNLCQVALLRPARLVTK